MWAGSFNQLYTYADDQHYQIIEFANYKLGNITGDQLAWEFKYQERQTIQPFIAYGIFKVLAFFHVTHPFEQLQWLRILMSGFVVFALYRFVVATVSEIHPPFRKTYVAATFLMGYIPAIYLHFASETASQVLLLLGSASLLSGKKGRGHWVWAGVYFGLAFFCRFQSVLTFAGLFGGLLLTGRYRFAELLKLIPGFGLALLAGILIDRWFYGNWVLTPYNYLSFQILEGGVDKFGTSPAYAYLQRLFMLATPFFGLLLYPAWLALLLRRKFHPVFLSVLSTLLILSMVGHKEDRFLYQILLFIPFTVVKGWEVLFGMFPRLSGFFSSFFVRTVLISANILLVIMSLLQNTSVFLRGQGTLAWKITRDYYEQPVTLYTTGVDRHPFKINGFNPYPAPGESHSTKEFIWRHFIMPRDYEEYQIASFSDTLFTNGRQGRTEMLYAGKYSVERLGLKELEKAGYRQIATTVPGWLEALVFWDPEVASRLDFHVYYLFLKENPVICGQ